MIPNVGPLELVIVLVIALIVLGPKKLPEFGRSVGRGMREFRGALSGEASRRDDAYDDDEPEGAHGREVGTTPRR
jgi:sec-independent protein translocase protein TatA